MWVEDTTVNSITYQLLSIPECVQISDPGKPALPIISKMIAIAPQKRVNLIIDSLDFSTYNNYCIFPAQFQQNDSSIQRFLFVIDETLYAQSNFYPEIVADHTPPNIFRDLRVTNISLFPISFNPKINQLRVLKNFILRAEFVDNDTFNILPSWPVSVSPTFANIYQAAIFNYSTLGIQPEPLYTRLQYLVISDASFINTLNPFVFWKKKKGLDVYLESIKHLRMSATPILTIGL